MLQYGTNMATLAASITLPNKYIYVRILWLFLCLNEGMTAAFLVQLIYGITCLWQSMSMQPLRIY